MKLYRTFAVLGVMLTAGCLFWLRQPAERPGTAIDIAPAAAAAAPDRPRAIPTPVPKASPSSTRSDVREEERRERDRISRTVLPLLDSLGVDGRVLHERLVSERPDADWAPAAEHEMRSYYDNLKDFGGTGRALDVQCGATVCQVTGDLADAAGGDREKAAAAVQSFDLVQTMAAKGYSWQSTSVGKGGDGQPIFVSFFLRSAPEVLKTLPAAPAPGG